MNNLFICILKTNLYQRIQKRNAFKKSHLKGICHQFLTKVMAPALLAFYLLYCGTIVTRVMLPDHTYLSQACQISSFAS